ncbi:MAG: ribosome-binding factor A [Geobacter sp.]|nr:ribosome-binding factor A [Geobacter sp.]
MYKRSEKIAEAVHEFISGLLVKGLKDPRIGFVTITAVEVSDDLHLAKVYFTVIGSDEEKKAAQDGLNSSRSFLRREMGKQMKMRYVPDIVFRYDTSLEYGNRIDSLLRNIATEHGPDTEEHS